MKSSQNKSIDAREVALKCLIQVMIKGRSLSELQSLLNDHQQASLIREMVFGVCRWYFYFEVEAKKQLKKPLRNKDKDVLIIIFLGMYQLQFMNTSRHAAVNETVNLVFKIKKKWAKGLVNALLRHYTKNIPSIDLIDESTSYPEWMVEKFAQDWPEELAHISQYGNEKAATSLRVNSKKLTPTSFFKILKEQEISFDEEATLPSFVRLNQSQNITQLPGFDQGNFYVQDGSAQMAAQLLNVSNGMNVLDACAAPGGKSTHIAELADHVSILAVEKEENRIQRLKENIDRLGHNIQVVCGDAAKPEVWFKGDQYDRILIDAPCSASGIIRRHPDIKLLRRKEDIASLVELQAEILKSLWPLLKKGGELLYCTCSIFKQENEQQIESFMQKNNDCIELKMKPFDWVQVRPFGLQVLPSSHGFDGFYYAKLKKVET